MERLPPTLRDRIQRVAVHDAALAADLGDVLVRLVEASTAMAWARERLPGFVAASGPSAVLELLVSQARELTSAPEVWAVSWTKVAGRVQVRALSGHSEAGAPARTADGELLTPAGLSRSIVARVTADARPAWSDDASADARFLGAASVQQLSLRSVGCVPVGGSAVLYLFDPTMPGRFARPDRVKLTALAAVAAPFLEAPREPTAGPTLLLPGLVGSAPAMLELFAGVRAFAPMPWPCLILGETGTGKEAVAAALHGLSAQAEGPFVPVNCGAIPVDLAESLLFGHERGAFTGADERRDGLAAQAAGGTLFLDEIGDLPAAVQVKLLRLLEQGSYCRVGSVTQVPFTGRVVAATHRAIDEGVDGFRADLYHRLSAAVLRVPPLRDRLADVPELARHLLARSLTELPGAPHLELSAAAVAQLQVRAWPGNVRELGNVLRGAIARCLARGAAEVGAADLGSGPPGVAAARLCGDLAGATARFQQAQVVAALEAAGGNRTRAAELLGVSRQWLHRLMARREVS